MEALYVCVGDDFDFASFQNMKELSYLFVSGGDYSGVDYLNLEALLPLEKLRELRLHLMIRLSDFRAFHGSDVMYGQRLEFLKNHFQDNSIRCLAEIFDKARKIESESQIEELQQKLRWVLQEDKSNGLSGIIEWRTSPSGSNHVVATESLCLFINIYGVKVLFENPLFFEGELATTNYHWIEEDNLVVFDVLYIVHDKWEKCICHFAPDDFFAYLTPIQESYYRTQSANGFDFDTQR